jgi:hypothetical protein
MEVEPGPKQIRAMTVTVPLSPEAERLLKEKVAHSGQTIESYLAGLVEADLGQTPGPSLQKTPDQGAPPTVLPQEEEEEWPEVILPAPEGETIFTRPATFPLEGAPRCELDVTIDSHWLEEQDDEPLV